MKKRTARKVFTGLSIAMSLPSALLGTASAQQATATSRATDWTPAGAAAADPIKRSLHISKASGTDNVLADMADKSGVNTDADANAWAPAGAAAADKAL